MIFGSGPGWPYPARSASDAGERPAARHAPAPARATPDALQTAHQAAATLLSDSCAHDSRRRLLPINGAHAPNTPRGDGGSSGAGQRDIVSRGSETIVDPPDEIEAVKRARAHRSPSAAHAGTVRSDPPTGRRAKPPPPRTVA
jgi:hypothetical protein